MVGYQRIICATGVCYCIRVVMSKHHMKGLVILVVLDVLHWLWHHNVIGVFIWHEWHLAPVIFSLFLALLIGLAFSQAVYRGLGGWSFPFCQKFSRKWQQNFAAYQSSLRQQGHKGTNHYHAKICRSCRMLSLCVSSTSIKLSDANVRVCKFCDLIMPQCDFCPPVYIFKLIWKKL